MARGHTEIKKLERLAKREGWDVRMTGSGHFRFVPPDPEADIIIVSATPRSGRSLRTSMHQLRAAGLPC